MHTARERPTLVRISNSPRDYDWGSVDGLPQLLGLPRTGAPQAELWLGAHPAWPSRLDDGTGLDAHLEAHGRAQPGILLKALSAAHALSLQAHPTPTQARAGFVRENAAGVPIDAGWRSYKDARSKPEMLVATSSFEALSGFRSLVAARSVLAALAAIDARVAPILYRLTEPGAAFAWLLDEGQAQAEVVAGIVAAAPALGDDHATERDTIARLAADHPGDPGIAIALLLHRVSLAPGEGIALPAGNLHAYLEGTGIELMEASDNVLRGGLTSKHVDRAELLAVVDPTPIAEPRIAGQIVPGGVRFDPDLPFALTHVTGEVAGASSTAIVLAIAPARVRLASEELALSAGEAAFAAGGQVTVTSGDAWLAEDRSDTPGAEQL